MKLKLHLSHINYFCMNEFNVFIVIKNNGMACKIHFYWHLRYLSINSFYPLLTSSGGCTTFKHASTNSVKIGSSIYSCINWSGCDDLSSNCNIFLTCGFSRHCFNSVDCSVTISKKLRP